MVGLSEELESPPWPPVDPEEEDEPPWPAPPELLPLSELLGASGTSGSGSGPAETVTLIRLLNLTVEPAAVPWAMTVPAGWSL